MRLRDGRDSLFIGPEKIGHVRHRIGEQVPGRAEAEGEGGQEAEGEAAVAGEDGAGEGRDEGLVGGGEVSWGWRGEGQGG